MVRHMFNCIKSDKNVALPYGIFLTCIFEQFGIELSNESYKNRHLYLKRGSSVKQHKKGLTRTEKVVFGDIDDNELDDIHPPSTLGTSGSTGHKSFLFRIVKDVLQEFMNLSNHLFSTSKQERKLVIKHENALKKSTDRVDVLMKYVDNIQEDKIMVTSQEERLDFEEDGSDA
ncbi:uncharacterized protein DS421_7g210130 [Arachis hypogaea]|nr:uncharacterized protein DS421_7g210130 [Arachis hypogaea]